MAAQVIDGKQVSKDIRNELKERVGALAAKGVVPGLAVILVGEDPASVSYVTGKEEACDEVGIRKFGKHLPEKTPESELIALIEEYNRNPEVHGILVQFPLPKHIDKAKVVAVIRPEKDTDGSTAINAGYMLLEEPCFLPCTPAGVIELIKRSGVKTDGAQAVVIGRSNLTGKPLQNLLVRRSLNATVTLCHTGTKNLAEHVGRADIVIACAGSPGLVKGDWIKPGACVIDVGVNRVEDPTAKKGFRLKGDVEYASAAERAAFITPVPGGVGPMTITMLMANTVESAERAASR
ncbi:MAG: bifunctional 5,10-methylene-tetrahydrofolate dehydrogenase/5,10-methylene-tetrahydrofolate cyclohydrolase [Treponema sp.]|nr:bifunctional 5,10-methylene-tetrahydrofolate dehydrogenase/5,10-methylene-tetrahydrofolate cyclohydrolase [Treponema sp.]